MKAPHLGEILALVLSTMVLLSSAAPFQCREPNFTVCSEQDKLTSIQERLLIRHVISKRFPSLTYNITANMPPEDMYSLAEDSDETPSSEGQQGFTVEPCEEEHFSIEDRFCQWSYQCDFSALRLPTTIFQAQLIGSVNQSKMPRDLETSSEQECQCKKVTVWVPVLRFQNCTLDGKEEWTRTMTPVNVGYSCVPVPVH